MSKTTTTDAAALQAFAETEAGRKLLELGLEVRAAQRHQEQERHEHDAQLAVIAGIKSALAAERAALEGAGLQQVDGSDASGLCPSLYDQQPVFLLNKGAHPSALVTAALSRAERAQAVARMLEQSPEIDRGTEDVASVLTRMIEEVVNVLQVTLAHEQVAGAPASTATAA